MIIVRQWMSWLNGWAGLLLSLHGKMVCYQQREEVNHVSRETVKDDS
jgi:hypothetical protein